MHSSGVIFCGTLLVVFQGTMSLLSATESFGSNFFRNLDFALVVTIVPALLLLGIAAFYSADTYTSLRESYRSAAKGSSDARAILERMHRVLIFNSPSYGTIAWAYFWMSCLTYILIMAFSWWIVAKEGWRTRFESTDPFSFGSAIDRWTTLQTVNMFMNSSCATYGTYWMYTFIYMCGVHSIKRKKIGNTEVVYFQEEPDQ